MPRPPSPSIPEKEFLFSSLKQSLRLDGRQPLEMRTPVLTFGPDLGWVECALGKTRVLAQVDAKMVKPPPERPLEGRPSDEEVTMTRMLDKILRRSDAIDKESLCVLAGQRVWHLRLTIHCLADTGNLLDCACLAGIVAFRHFRRPEVEVVGDEITIHHPSERAPVSLSMHHTPFCFTFAYFPDPETRPVLDPSHLEQRLSAGIISVALNAQKELCVVQKAGGVPLSQEDVMGAIQIAAVKAVELDGIVTRRLEEDWKGRKVEVR